MKIIVFAGGTGKRFWPVSRVNSPKQFSPLISGRPLLRIRIDTLLKKFKPADIYISTGKRYQNEVFEIAKDLPKENIIFEPDMRDTGPAVTLALMYVSKLHPNEVVSIQWSDHLIKDTEEFLNSLIFSENKVIESGKTIITTVPARYPSPDRGYVEEGEKIKDVTEKTSLFKFVSFKEKPDSNTAEKYIKEKRFSWNLGYWNTMPDVFLDIVKEKDLKIFEACKDLIDSDFKATDKFISLEKKSADYLFAENLNPNNTYLLKTDIGWSDVGEWVALKEALEESRTSNVIRGNVFDMNSEDCIIFNLDNSKLISTIGLKGMVIVSTNDVFAVFSKDSADKLKEYLKRLEETLGIEYI